MTVTEARALKVGNRVKWNDQEGRVEIVTGISMVSVRWDLDDSLTHHDPDFMEDFEILRPATPAPTPHARKRPNITMTMLEGLRIATLSGNGIVGCDRGAAKGLERRGLATWSPEHNHYVITENGRLLVATQYEALKQVLPDNRTSSDRMKAKEINHDG